MHVLRCRVGRDDRRIVLAGESRATSVCVVTGARGMLLILAAVFAGGCGIPRSIDRIADEMRTLSQTTETNTENITNEINRTKNDLLKVAPELAARFDKTTADTVSQMHADLGAQQKLVAMSQWRLQVEFLAVSLKAKKTKFAPFVSFVRPTLINLNAAPVDESIRVNGLSFSTDSRKPNLKLWVVPKTAGAERIDKSDWLTVNAPTHATILLDDKRRKELRSAEAIEIACANTSTPLSRIAVDPFDPARNERRVRLNAFNVPPFTPPHVPPGNADFGGWVQMTLAVEFQVVEDGEGHDVVQARMHVDALEQDTKGPHGDRTHASGVGPWHSLRTLEKNETVVGIGATRKRNVASDRTTFLENVTRGTTATARCKGDGIIVDYYEYIGDTPSQFEAGRLTRAGAHLKDLELTVQPR